jgi:hypothetical protein
MHVPHDAVRPPQPLETWPHVAPTLAQVCGAQGSVPASGIVESPPSTGWRFVPASVSPLGVSGKFTQYGSQGFVVHVDGAPNPSSESPGGKSGTTNACALSMMHSDHLPFVQTSKP